MRNYSHVSFILLLSGLILFAVSLCMYLGRFWWWFDVVSTFRPQLAIAMLIWMLVGLLQLDWRWMLVFAVGFLVNVPPLLPYYIPSSDRANLKKADESGAKRAELRVLVFNVYSGNWQKGRTLKYLQKQDADLVLLMEVTDEWERELEPIKAAYQCQFWDSRPDNFGIALLSKFPCAHIEHTSFGNSPAPVLIVDLSVLNRDVRVYGLHPFPPVDDVSWGIRDSQLQELSESLEDRKGTTLVLGDLNLAPWSFIFQDLLAKGNLRDSALGFGIYRTWPTGSLIVSAVIDHILVSEEIIVRDRRRGPKLGSDHFPVEADISIVEAGGFVSVE